MTRETIQYSLRQTMDHLLPLEDNVLVENFRSSPIRSQSTGFRLNVLPVKQLI